MKDTYSKALDALIAPQKLQYSSEYLGPKHTIFRGKYVNRKDFDLKNQDGFLLKSSIFIPDDIQPYSPCVIYLHTRGGGRIEGRGLLKLMLPKYSVLLFDFAGSGQSEGDHITLGIKENRDLNLIVDHIRKTYQVGSVILWGRSMGAVTSLLFANEHKEKVSAIILDSPFTNFDKMVGDLVRSQRKVPRCLISCILCCLVKSAKKKVGVDLQQIQPEKIVASMAVPAFFMVGREDFLARPGRLKELFDKYGSPNKQFFLIEGMHQTMRDQKVQEKASAFIKEVLDTEEFIRLSTGSTRTDETSGLLVENHPKLQQGQLPALQQKQKGSLLQKSMACPPALHRIIDTGMMHTRVANSPLHSADLIDKFQVQSIKKEIN